MIKRIKEKESLTSVLSAKSSSNDMMWI